MSGVTVATMMASRSEAAMPRSASAFARPRPPVAGRHTLVHEVAFADADPLHDPLVVGVDHLFQVGVGEKAGWNVGAESADLNALKLAQ